MRQLAYRQDWADYYLGLFGHGKARGWFDAKMYLRKLADYCNSNGIKLLVPISRSCTTYSAIGFKKLPI